MSNHTVLYIAIICWAVISCKPEVIERPLPKYITEYYGDCEQCPEENFLELNNSDTSIYFQMGYNEDIFLPGVKSKPLARNNPGRNGIGFGAILFSNTDSVITNQITNVDVYFDLYDTERICAREYAWECGSYLFDETRTPEGVYIGINGSLGMRISVLLFPFIDNERAGRTLLSTQSSTLFEVTGFQQIPDGIFKICGSYKANMFEIMGDSTTEISGRFSIPVNYILSRPGCD